METDPLSDEQTVGYEGSEVPSAKRFGPYRVERELARGGFGVVYQALHEQTGIRYAVKTMLTGLGGAGSEDLLRFQREGELLAKLDHPHVVRVHTAGLDRATPYLVQDLLPGDSLKEVLRRGPLKVDRAVEIGIKLASALAHTHAAGVLHRDLKPSNVMFDDRGEPRLVDFGLGRKTAGSSLTGTGWVMGTPSYMAPEQAEGRKDLGPAADIYGLGALLYALLTGRPPFNEGTHMATLEAVVGTPPVPLSKIRPEVPPEVEAVCLKALAKKPEDRYPSAGALGAALEVSLKLSIESTSAPPERRTDRRWLLLVPAALILALLGALLWFTSAPPPPRAATKPRASASPVAATPSPVRDDGLAWRLEVGEVLRYQVHLESPEGWLEWVSSQRVTIAEPDRLVLEATITSFKAEAGSGPTVATFDSELGDEEQKPLVRPLRHLVDRSYQLHLDPHTGEVLAMRGLDELRVEMMAIPGVKDLLGQLLGFLGNLEMKRDHQGLYHFLPGEPLYPGSDGSWELPLLEPPRGSDVKGHRRFSMKREAGDIGIFSGGNCNLTMPIPIRTRQGSMKMVESRLKLDAAWRDGRLVRSEAVEAAKYETGQREIYVRRLTLLD